MKPSWHRFAFCLLPERLITRVVGAFARSRLSRVAIPWFVRHFGIDLEELDRPLSEFTSLLDLFIRRLRQGVRPIHPEGVISPVDGTVRALGRIEGERLLQVKGVHYSLARLLGSREDAALFADGHYITLYLSPRDYHRIHVPLDGVMVGWRYIPGRLFPVNAWGMHHVQGLFTKNERMVTFVRTVAGRMAVVKVGATIVGSIRTDYAPNLERAWRRGLPMMEGRGDGRLLRRGMELGRFEFGSTVILVFEAGMLESFVVAPGEAVRMGQLIATLRSCLPV
ncbi:phosphatidylserine decarboxylase proenzyme [Alicyclobacillus cellulosilyticus]|uniref:Phosphatidylserine decarboxylase proenzyme n=1 Tax=Alicyclobacillus cellulosilyticus TaxID=1003997 RepID=A0A917KCF9_9BACL|nr:archaetidylserine decarboxylase [Alicyclobacillus cellulosilyticus]GGJ08105.1 phosphatidylserine decarboxylase proenzyme [Alicyclobacillus cellulosilyticus]